MYANNQDNRIPPLLNSHLQSGKLAHGYLLVGSLEEAKKIAILATEALLPDFDGKRADLHPDFLMKESAPVGIEEIRNIISLSSVRPSSGAEKKIIFINADGLSAPAANALLKTVEEPSSTIFFFSVSAEDGIITTLKSRLVKITLPAGDNEELLEHFGKFNKKTYAQKIAQVKKIAESKDGEMEIFLNAYEVYFENELKKEGTDERGALKSLEALLRARELLSMPAAYPKAVLEYLVINTLNL